MQARNGSVDELQSLRGLVSVKLEELAHSIQLQRSGNREEAIELVRSNVGKSAMDAIGRSSASACSSSSATSSRLMALEREARDATLLSSISVSVLAVFLMMVLAYVVRRDSARLRLSEERLATTCAASATR